MKKEVLIGLVVLGLFIMGVNGCGADKEESIWMPSQEDDFQWQLSGEVSLEDANVYDIDLFDNEKSVVDAIHESGGKAICYISVGSREDWRGDANDFPESVIGNDYEDWKGEKWLDISNGALKPIMEKRLDLCKEKGFDGVEPDNIQNYIENTGFPLSYEDQIRYNKWLAEEAHERGLSIGLKNNGKQASGLLDYFDWALVESCFYYDECADYVSFVDSGKAVFAVEYSDNELGNFCVKAKELGFNAMLKNRDLDAWREVC